jgi:hypothetical protein
MNITLRYLRLQCRSFPRRHRDLLHDFLLLANPGTTAGDVTITNLPEGGTPVTKTYGLAAKQRHTINVAFEDLPLGGTPDFWLGPTLTLRKDDLAVRMFAIVNTGDLGVGRLGSDGTVVSGFTDDDARGAHGRGVARGSGDGPRARTPQRAGTVCDGRS